MLRMTLDQIIMHYCKMDPYRKKCQLQFHSLTAILRNKYLACVSSMITIITDPKKEQLHSYRVIV